MKMSPTKSNQIYSISRDDLLGMAVREICHDVIRNFDEKLYIECNEDVAISINSGVFKTGNHHWLTFGYKENRPGTNLDHLYEFPYSFLVFHHIAHKQVNLARSILELNGEPCHLVDLIKHGGFRAALSFLQSKNLIERKELLVRKNILLLYSYFLTESSSYFDLHSSIAECIAFLRIIKLSETIDAKFYFSSEIYWSTHRYLSLLLFCCDKRRSALRVSEKIFSARLSKKPRMQPIDCLEIAPEYLVTKVVLDASFFSFTLGDFTRCVGYITTVNNSLFRMKDFARRCLLREPLKKLYDAILDLDSALVDLFIETFVFLGSAETETTLLGQTLNIHWLMLSSLNLHTFNRIFVSCDEKLKIAKEVFNDKILFDIIFVIGDESETKRYRALNFLDCMLDDKLNCLICSVDEIQSLISLKIRFLNLVVVRCTSSASLEQLIHYAARLNARTYIDIDDLFFDSTIIHMIDGINLLPKNEKNDIVSTIERYRNSLFLCDRAITPTKQLSEHITSLGVKADTVPNTFSYYELMLARIYEKYRFSFIPKPKGAIFIGYFSGSWTHNKDFLECETALIEILTKNEHVYYVDTGFVNLSGDWRALQNRIIRLAPAPHHLMLQIQATCDIAIAPLELNNTFCDSKSELKFFESALFGIPIVASPSLPMIQSISDGVNGFLAKNHDEWSSKLQALVNDAKLRYQVGAKAKAYALKKFSVEVAKTKYWQLLQLSRESRHVTQSGSATKKASIAFIATDFSAGSGGLRNILNLANALTLFGHNVMIKFIFSSAGMFDLKSLIQSAYGPVYCSVLSGQNMNLSSDIIIATHNSTVDFSLQIANGTKSALFYYVQDFEPWFDPIGTRYFDAEMSYYKIKHIITYTDFVAKLLDQEYGIKADHIDMFVDRSIYFPRHIGRDSERIVAFARPEMPRRCFELIVQALEIVKFEVPQVKVVFFGSDHRPNYIPFDHEWWGAIHDYNRLATLYSSGRLGIAISPTNPSHMPFEMMACGLPVVDIQWKNSKYNSDRYKNTVTAGLPDPKILAQNIISLFCDDFNHELIVGKGKELALSLNLLPQSARQFEKILLSKSMS